LHKHLALSLSDTEKEQIDASLEQLSGVVARLVHSGIAFHAIHQTDESKDIMEAMLRDARAVSAAIIQLEDIKSR
jgi:hypothetical protein